MNGSIVYNKSYDLALRIIRLHSFLTKEKKEYVLSKQVLRSGTDIGALISEAKFAQSKADFINKMHVALKEANETLYWLSLLRDSRYLTESMFETIFSEVNEIISLLVSIVKTSKNNSNINS